MGIAKILAPVTGAKRDVAVIATAVEAARPFNAHVMALFVRSDAREAVPYTGVPISPVVVQQIIDAAGEVATRAAHAARSTLGEVASRLGAEVTAVPVRGERVTVSFRDVTGRFDEQVENAAKLSDLVVFGPARDESDVQVSEAMIETLTATQRPVLLATESAPAAIARNIALGWDGGMAAAHALTAAMPYLKRAARVEIFCAEEAGSPDREFDAVKEYLALHGVTATLRVFACGSASKGEALLKEATRAETDLLAIGGYGHSRLRETVFGGVTAHILSHATMPVLLVH